jgi:hypothetical protein
MADSQGEGLTRRYSDAEVRLLLERAARSPVGQPPTRRQRGLTLAEIEEAAAEAGIDVDRLRHAARTLDVETALQARGIAARLAGAPLRLRQERTLPFEIDAATLGSLAHVLATLVDDPGEASMVGTTFTWRSSRSTGRRTDILISARAGGTVIQVEERYTEVAGGVFGGLIGGIGGGVGIGGGTALAAVSGSIALAFVIPATVIAGTYAACRTGYTAYVRHRARNIDELIDRIADHLTRN